MIKKIVFVTALFQFVILVDTGLSQDKEQIQKLNTPSEKLGYALGADIGHSFKKNEMNIDVKAFVRGFTDALTDKSELLMTPEERDAIQKAAIAEMRKKLAEKEKQKSENTTIDKELLQKKTPKNKAILSKNKDANKNTIEFAETDKKKKDIGVFLGNTDDDVMLRPCVNFNSNLYSTVYAVYNNNKSELSIVGEKKNSKDGRFALLDKQVIEFVGVIDDFYCESTKIVLHGKWAFRATVLTYNFIWDGHKLIKCNVKSDDYTQNQIDELRDMALEGKLTSKSKAVFEEGSVIYPQNYFRKEQISDLSIEGLKIGVLKAGAFHKNHNDPISVNILKGIFYYVLALYEESFLVDDNHPYTLPPDKRLFDEPEFWVRVLKEMGVKTEYYITNLNDYGFYLVNTHKYQDAIIVLKVVLKEKPDRIPAYLNLADAYYGNGDRKEALINYKAYIELMKKHKKENSIPSYVIDRAK